MSLVCGTNRYEPSAFVVGNRGRTREREDDAGTMDDSDLRFGQDTLCSYSEVLPSSNFKAVAVLLALK